MRFFAGALMILASGMLALSAAGCGPRARISFAAGGEDQTVKYNSATFQLARDRRVQVVLYRQTAAPFGDPDPDFEYVFFELPERRRFGWLREDHLPIYRWVRQDGRDHLWLGASGEAQMRFGIFFGRDLHLEFHTTMVPLRGTEGGVYIFRGNVKCREDMVRTQGLINRYSEWLESLLAAESREKGEAE